MQTKGVSSNEIVISYQVRQFDRDALNAPESSPLIFLFYTLYFLLFTRYKHRKVLEFLIRCDTIR